MELGIRIVFALVVICVLIYITYYVLRIVNKKMLGRKGEYIKIVDLLPLSQDSILVLVEIGDKVILLGKTQKSITFLKEFSKDQLFNLGEQHHSFKNIIDNQINSSFEMKNKVLNLYNLIKDSEGKEDDEKNKSLYIISTLLLILITTCTKKEIAFATASLNINLGNPQNPNDVSSALQLIIFLTILTLAPSILIMMTSFTRILIVLGFIRNALGTQQMPPNQILIGLALFLTFFVMAPVTDKIYTQAYQPYINGRITSQEALKRAEEPLKEFMLKNTRKKDLDLFVKLSNVNPNTNVKDLPLRVVVPAFIISELKSAFEMGFLIYVPFLIIDMVVASILMSMGMLMIPPVMISLPFKILLFILVDGWNLVVESLVRSFK